MAKFDPSKMTPEEFIAHRSRQTPDINEWVSSLAFNTPTQVPTKFINPVHPNNVTHKLYNAAKATNRSIVIRVFDKEHWAMVTGHKVPSQELTE